MSLIGKHCVSKIFQPIVNIPKSANVSHKDVTSKSQRLMLELGIIQQANPGCFHFLPLGYKSLDKLIKIVDTEMSKIGGQKVISPTLINLNLWKDSGRLNDAGPELLQLKDRHDHSYILSPTHEEAISDLLSSIPPLSYKNFPLRLYQITSKFRDEMRPRFGLMRGREFLMKDMYSFDVDVDSAKNTYAEVCYSYDKVFQKIGVPFAKIRGTPGNMGGTLSHEYQFKAPIGEDLMFLCKTCNYSANVELSGDEKCPSCGEESNIGTQHGIEVGHTFYLGDKYTKPLRAHYLSQKGKPEILQMGSYGLGLSRILAASLEVLSTEIEMCWPDIIAPYNVIIIPPKMGSKEEESTKHMAKKLYETLENKISMLKDNVLIDDRIAMTIGRRHMDARRTGYRYIVIINYRSMENVPLFELNDSRKQTVLYLTADQICDYIKENTVF